QSRCQNRVAHRLKISKSLTDIPVFHAAIAQAPSPPWRSTSANLTRHLKATITLPTSKYNPFLCPLGSITFKSILLYVNYNPTPSPRSSNDTSIPSQDTSSRRR